jgi:hypothetical protein
MPPPPQDIAQVHKILAHGQGRPEIDRLRNTGSQIKHHGKIIAIKARKRRKAGHQGRLALME